MVGSVERGARCRLPGTNSVERPCVVDAKGPAPNATQLREVRSTSGEPAQVARKRADVRAASARDRRAKASAVAHDVTPREHVYVRWREDELIARARSLIGATSGDALCRVRGRDLLDWPRELHDGFGNRLVARRLGGTNDSTLEIVGLRFGTKCDDHLVLLRHSVEIRKGPSAGPSAGPSTNAVTAWNEIAVNTLIGLPATGGRAPPAAQIHVAMVQGAVYDAVNAIEPKHHRPYLLTRRFSATRLRGGRRRDRGVRRPREHRLHRARKHPVPDQGELLQSLAAQYASVAGRRSRTGRSRRRGSPPGRPRPTR